MSNTLLSPPKPKLVTRALWLVVDFSAIVGAAVLLKLAVHYTVLFLHR